MLDAKVSVFRQKFTAMPESAPAENQGVEQA
jgi:hypothetical protein